MNFNDKHHMRYQDDLDRERIIYYNGQYYRIKEAYFSGGPYSMPHGLWDPFGPWRMARPIPHNLEYWTDLDYRYQNTMRDALKKVTTEHYESDLASVTFNGSLLNAPIGTKVEVLNLYTITVQFGDSKLNYSVEIDPQKVYHIDYMANGALRSVIGRVSDIDVVNGKDYRGDKTVYTVLNVDCSNDFKSNKRLIDSRDIRYIQCLTDLQTASSITKTFIGTREPDDPYYQYGAWFNPTESLYKVRNKQGEWVDVKSKPNENPEKGNYWKFNPNTFEWELNKIPEFIPDGVRECIWNFNESSERWERQLSVPRPMTTQLAKPENIPNEYWMPSKPETVAYYGKEWYFNTHFMMWTQREPKPKTAIDPTKQYYYDELTENWIIIPKVPDEQEELLDYINLLIENDWPIGVLSEIYVYGDDGNGNINWHKDVPVQPAIEFDGGIFGWVYSNNANRWFVTPRVPTYREKDNEWIWDTPNYFRIPKKTANDSRIIFNFYYNRWFYYPDLEDINNIDGTNDYPMKYESYNINRDQISKLYTQTSIMYFYTHASNNDRYLLVGDRHNWDRLARVDYTG